MYSPFSVYPHCIRGFLHFDTHVYVMAFGPQKIVVAHYPTWYQMLGSPHSRTLQLRASSPPAPSTARFGSPRRGSVRPGSPRRGSGRPGSPRWLRCPTGPPLASSLLRLAASPVAPTAAPATEAAASLRAERKRERPLADSSRWSGFLVCPRTGNASRTRCTLPREVCVAPDPPAR